MDILKSCLSASLALLAGCAQQPVESLPQAEIPPGWSVPATAQAPAWPDQDWWKGFHSEELNELIALAQRNNLDISAAAARVLQAEAQTRIAGATLLPRLDLDASASRQGGSGSNPRGSSFGAGLGASYEIDFWGRNRADLAASQATLAASRFDRETVALTVTAAVAETYLQVLSLRDRLRIAGLNLANAERVLQLTEARVRNGAASPLELAQQRSVVAQQRAGIPPLQQQEREALLALATLLGQPPQRVTVAAQSLLPVQVPAVTPGLPSELLQRRPDIRRSEAQLAAAQANIAAARAAMFPSVSLTGSAGLRGDSLSSLFDGNPLYTLGASLLVPIFNAGRLEAERDLAQARELELVQDYRAVVIAAFMDVESALSAIENASEQQRLQAEVLEQARLALSLAEVRYREGAEDLLTVLDAQRTFYQAQDQAQQIQLTRLQALVDLFMALGGGWMAPPAQDGSGNG